MKHFSKLIFLFSLCKIITACGITNPTKADDCKDVWMVEAIKYEIKYKNGEYKNIGKLKKNFEKDYQYDYSLDCNSSFLQVYLILALSFILF